MNYTSWKYYCLVFILIPLYYLIPKRFRWFVLLTGSICFYVQIMTDIDQLYILVGSVILSYLAGITMHRLRNTDRIQERRLILFLGIILSAMPLLLEKIRDLSGGVVLNAKDRPLIVPIGLSFYTLQLIAYLADVYKGKTDAELNPLKYFLFITFFPQIIQGPIPRYKQLGEQLFDGNDFDPDNIMKGIQLIVWGFFLKYMIADKAAVVANTVFDYPDAYSGLYIWVGGSLYCMQLYADFLSCTTISQGVSEMFGIRISDNFNRPFLAASVKDFWRRWHMSLSYWLRDYIYIPLGGNKRGPLFKWLNLTITYAVSGLWHGGSIKYLIWGLCQVFYQMVAEIRDNLVSKWKLEKYKMKNTGLSLFLKRIGTFILFLLSVIIFRADTLWDGLLLIKNMLTVFNPWVLFDDSLFLLGLSMKESLVLTVSLIILLYVSLKQEAGVRLRDVFGRQNMAVRWIVYLLAIWSIWIFGSYGFGFDANDFLYGGF